MRVRTHPRPATAAVEAALVFPLVFFLLLALVVGAMGVFRYQEVATLAREAARYASTHGRQYRQDARLPTGGPGSRDRPAGYAMVAANSPLIAAS